MYTFAIDIGNSRSKVAGFAGPASAPEFVWTFSTSSLEADLTARLPPLWAGRAAALRVGYVSVAAEVEVGAWPLWQRLGAGVRCRRITVQSPMPLRNDYASPHTLGADRIVAVVGARGLAAEAGPVLVIDAGTALTYDFCPAEGAYQGGGISPGLQMRFQALHAFTARLPLLHCDPACAAPPLVGGSTSASIQSGVVNGLLAEVRGIVAEYRALAGPGLRVWLTGGDAVYLAAQLKAANFADFFLDPYLVLRGVNIILSYDEAGDW